jgi:hypothetical protein
MTVFNKNRLVAMGALGYSVQTNFLSITLNHSGGSKDKTILVGYPNGN